ncbi:MAG TPA: DNA polymerase III subunit delta' [Beijerinckiaceae bacterium]
MASKANRPEQGFEPDRFPGAPHAREQAALIGHAEAEQAFLDGFASGRLHHAWLIGGAEGIGKATLAYRVGRYLLARGPQSTGSLAVPAEEPAARQVASLSHPNLVALRRVPPGEGKPASATIAVDHVRKALQLFQSTSADGGYRVCIVDSAEDLTIASANALLKALEEPPPRSLFLIVSHAPQRLLPTIRSRCRRLSLRALNERDLRAVLATLGEPWSAAEETLVAAAIDLGDGSVRRTLEMLDAETIGVAEEVRRLLTGLPELDLRRVMTLVDTVTRRGAEGSYNLALDLVERWASERLRRDAGRGAARLAPLAEVCEKLKQAARSADTYNLDRRPVLISALGDLAKAVERAA